jgi:hypothetical protein
MTESLEKIRDALSKHAPSVMPVESCGGDNDGRIIDSLLFVGRRLAFLVSEYADGCVELFVRESDCLEEPCRLLVREKWHTVAKIGDPVGVQSHSGDSERRADQAQRSKRSRRHGARQRPRAEDR